MEYDPRIELRMWKKLAANASINPITVRAYKVMAYVAMAYIVMAHIVTVYKVIAYTSMADMFMAYMIIRRLAANTLIDLITACTGQTCVRARVRIRA